MNTDNRFIIRRPIAACVLILGMATGAFAQPPAVSYSLAMTRPHTHLFDVGVRINGLQPAERTIEFVMPAWRTGRYVVFDFAGGVQHFAARDGSGRILPWKKRDKQTWVIETHGSSDVQIDYQLYANETRDRTRGLDADHAFVDGAAVFMYAERYANAPVTIDIAPFAGWHVTTGLEPDTGRPNRFRAPNYQVVADCPIEIGTQNDFPFEAEGKPHVLMIQGEGNYDPLKIVGDLKAIVRFHKEFWGNLPYERYVFMVHLSPTMGGGTEHLNSTIMQTQPFLFRDPGSYRGFLGLVAHEYFHTWNVKQLRPAAFSPYDLSTEGYSRELWIAEGTTSYYSSLLMMRAGYGSVQSYLGGIAASVQGDRLRPGNRIQSLTESSFDAWIKYSRNRQNAFNDESDFYDKGSDVSQILDLEIRHRSRNTRSLDDVMREMARRYRSRGYTIDDFQLVCEELTGGGLQEFFDAYIHGVAPIPWEQFLGYAGLLLEPRTDGPSAFLGVGAFEAGSRTLIQRVLTGSPAYDSGISIGDELVALNGYRIRSQELNTRIGEMAAGDTIRITVFRDERLREFNVVLRAQPVPSYRVVPTKTPTTLQKSIFESWLGAAWESAKSAG